MKHTAHPHDPNSTVDATKADTTFMAVQLSTFEVLEFELRYKATAQSCKAIDPTMSSYWRSCNAPAPIELIDFDAKNDWVKNTFDGLSSPWNCGAERAGKSIDVMESMTAVTCVTPAIANATI